MASARQIEAFESVTQRAVFPEGSNLVALKAQFAGLPVKEASRWIERALALPTQEDSGSPVPF
jgi:hypothetical protein